MPTGRITVTALSRTPVKGLRISTCAHVSLQRGGVACDRLFYLVDDRGRLVNGKRGGGLQTVVADYEEPEAQLTLSFPDGSSVSAAVELGEPMETRFYSSPRLARVVRGPFAQALSEHLGVSLRLVAPADGCSAADRGSQGVLSAISRASLARLAQVADEAAIDPRRFRMTVEVDGISAHEEDDWVGHSFVLGDARVAFAGHVGRCIVTTRDPDSDVVDLATLDLLRSYRAGAATSEPLAFGVYGAVLEPGIVRVGDSVIPEEPMPQAAKSSPAR